MTHSNTPKPYLHSLHIRGDSRLHLSLDGVPLRGIESYKLEEAPGGVARLTVVVLVEKINADLDLGGFAEIFNSLTLDDKELVLRELKDLFGE